MNLDIKNIDFDNVKLNLINFLKNQSRFAGYNFEGSSLNILMDLLAYNTYYQMFYNNMTFNEMFLDSAIKRSSVVSLAKLLGYVPGSMKSSRSNIQVNISGNAITVDNLLIPEYTKFITSYQGQIYEFYTLEDYYLTDNGTVYESDIIEIVEGTLTTNSFIADANYPFQKYVLPHLNVDISTIRVTVQNSESDTTGISDIWSVSQDITKINENSLVYFIEENSDGFYQIYFGDGVLGKKLSDGNKIVVKFLLSNENVNGIGVNGSTTVFTTPLYSTITNTITVVRPTYGGTSRESIQSIKTKAPKSFTTQERAVTVDDYSAIVMQQFANVKDVSCWGGEDNIPPEYGKIFISVKPKNGETLSLSEKEDIKTKLIRERCVVSILPVLVDPELMYLNTVVAVQVNPAKLKITKSALQSKVNATIQNFILNSIDIFNGDFYVNELIPIIDALDESIKGVSARVVMEKRFLPNFNQMTNYDIDYKNSIRETTCGETLINSSLFQYPDVNGVTRECQFKNGTDTNLDIVYTDTDSTVVTITTIGSINYLDGIISLYDFQPIALLNTDQLKIYAIPSDNNIFAEKNTILTVDSFSSEAIKISITDVSYRANL